MSESTKWVIPRSWYLRSDEATSSAEPTSQVVPAPPPPNLPGRRVEVVVEHLAARGQVEQPLLTDGLEAGVGALEGVLPSGHLGDLLLRVGPGLLGGVADEGGDPQPELERRVLAAELLGSAG